jgi:hypothetical protein
VCKEHASASTDRQRVPSREVDSGDHAGTDSKDGPTKEISMSIKRTIAALTLALASLSAPLTHAADGDAMQSFQREVQAMANKDGMVSKQEFLTMMGKKWDAMDKSNRRMLPVRDVMRIFSDDKGN